MLDYRREDSEDGWSLIEIMVGIVIMGILATISVLATVKFRAQGDKATITNESQNLKAAVQQVWVGNNKLYPMSAGGVPVTVSHPEGIFRPSNSKVQMQYYANKQRTAYCFNMTLGKQAVYYKSDKGEQSTPVPIGC